MLIMLHILVQDSECSSMGGLQDALVNASFQKSNKRVKDDQEFYDYEVFSPVRLGLSCAH